MIAFSRRRMLTAGLLGAFAATLHARPGSDRDPLAAALLELVADQAAASYLGRRYLALGTGPPPGRAELSGSIVAVGERDRWIGAALDERRRLLANRVAGDFRAGRVVDLDGWILAEAEARLCALAALPPT